MAKWQNKLCIIFAGCIMAAQINMAAAQQHKKKVQERIREVWLARQSIVFAEAKRVTPAEVTAALTGLEWEDEYSVKGRNTHVNIFVILTNDFLI